MTEPGSVPPQLFEIEAEWLSGKKLPPLGFTLGKATTRTGATFQPQWEPVYLVHRGVTRLPAVTAAILRAHLPELDWGDVAKLLTESVAERLRSPKDPAPPSA